MTETLLQTLFISYRKPINSVKGTRQGRKAGDRETNVLIQTLKEQSSTACPSKTNISIRNNADDFVNTS